MDFLVDNFSTDCHTTVTNLQNIQARQHSGQLTIARRLAKVKFSKDQASGAKRLTRAYADY
jgi:hypothetical protein